jgi:predicted DNA-binding transcriptional regulator AlpA
MSDDDPVLDAISAATFIGLATSTLAKMRCLGGGPRYIKLGRKIGYRRSDLSAWLSARRVNNTTEAMALPSRLTASFS